MISFKGNHRAAAVAATLALTTGAATNSSEKTPVIQEDFTTTSTAIYNSTRSSSHKPTDPFVGVSLSPVAVEQSLTVPTKSPPIGPVDVVSFGLALTSMLTFISRVRRGTTPVRFVSNALTTSNDGLLCIAAATTGQGLPSTIVLGVFAGLGIWSSIEARKRDPKSEASLTDKLCIIGCAVGWGSILTSLGMYLGTGIGNSTAILVASIVGTTTNLIGLLPLMKESLAHPKTSEISTSNRSRLVSIVNPAIPWIIGVAAYTIGLVAVPEHTFASLFQPIGLLATNIVITGMVLLWGNRQHRSSQQSKNS